MTSGQQDPLPPGSGWVLPPPPRTSPTERPGWARPTLAAGILCSVAVAWISARYFIGQAQGDPPSLAMVYMMEESPFLIAGFPLLLLGSLAAVRPWTHRRAWLRWAVAGGAVIWFLVAIQGPALLFVGR